MSYEVRINGRTRRVEIDRGGDRLVATVDGRRHVADVTVINGIWSLMLEGEGEGPGRRRSYQVAIVEQPPRSGTFAVHVDGHLLTAVIGTKPHASRRRGHEAAAGGVEEAGRRHVTAPMPGKIVRLLVGPGDMVTARQPIVVVEAMKMENELRAPKAGRVVEIGVAEGASVDAGAILAVIE